MKSNRFNDSGRNAASNEDPIKAMYPSTEAQNQRVTVLQNHAVKELTKQRDDVKRLTELRSQVRRTPVETHRPPRTSGSVASSGSSSKKKEGKGREGRDQLAKAVDRLKFEKIQLEKKVSDLMQAVHLAEVLNQRALLRSHEKDQVIMSLRKESVIASDIKLEEINRRCRLEAELEAIRIYVEYTQQKKAETLRNKAVQTETSIPTNLDFESIKPTSPFKKVAPSSTYSNNAGLSKSYSSYKALETNTSLWKTKKAELEFQKETRAMKHRFMTAVSKSIEPEETEQEELLKIFSAKQHRRYSYPAEELKASNGVAQTSLLTQTNENGLTEENTHPAKFFPSPPMSPSRPAQYIKSTSTYFPHSAHLSSYSYAKLKA